MAQMQAIRYKPGGGSAAEVFETVAMEKTSPGPEEILVKVQAVGLNPGDTKLRQGAIPSADVLGSDAAGKIESMGSNVPTKDFKIGDDVFYAGAIGQRGAMATHHVVNWRQVAHKPKKLGFAEAAGFPVVSLTAWEMFAYHFGLKESDPLGEQATKTILIINGAGGVGSIATQLARKVFSLGRVVVTASRPESIEHVKQMGATDVINHREKLKPQLERLGIQGVHYIMINHDTNTYMEAAIEIAAPFGKISSIGDIHEPLAGMHGFPARFKALSFSWEWLPTRTMFNLDIEVLGEITKRVGTLCDEGVLVGLLRENPKQLSLESAIAAHEQLEGGSVIGKLVLTVGDSIE